MRELPKEVGIDMTIQAVEVWFDATASGSHQITSAHQERTTDPDNFHSLVLRSGAPVNTTGHANPEVDALVGQAAASSDPEERKALHARIRTVVTQDAPLVFVRYETLTCLMNRNAAGSAITPSLSLHMENLAFTE